MKFGPVEGEQIFGLQLIARGGGQRSESIGMSDQNQLERMIGIDWNGRSESIGMDDRIRSEYANIAE